MSIFYRYNNQFKIDDNKLPESARNIEVKNSLYVDVYLEFLGASENIKYKHLTPLDRMNALNTYADKWLKDKGFK